MRRSHLTIVAPESPSRCFIETEPTRQPGEHSVGPLHFPNSKNVIAKILFSVLPLILMPGMALGQQPEDSSDPLIIAGKGWGKVSIGIDRRSIESVIGEGKNRSRYDDVYFIDYPAKGIQISYNNNDSTLHNVYFYNRQHRYENFAPFRGKTDKGIAWMSSPNDAIKAYGKPKEDYEGPGWRRLVFEGIDFRFENGTMVRIGIPGK